MLRTCKEGCDTCKGEPAEGGVTALAPVGSLLCFGGARFAVLSILATPCLPWATAVGVGPEPAERDVVILGVPDGGVSVLQLMLGFRLPCTARSHL